MRARALRFLVVSGLLSPAISTDSRRTTCLESDERAARLEARVSELERLLAAEQHSSRELRGELEECLRASEGRPRALPPPDAPPAGPLDAPWSGRRSVAMASDSPAGAAGYLGCFKNDNGPTRIRAMFGRIPRASCRAAAVLEGAEIFGLECPNPVPECRPLQVDLSELQPAEDSECELRIDEAGHRLGGPFRLAVYRSLPETWTCADQAVAEVWEVARGAFVPESMKPLVTGCAVVKSLGAAAGYYWLPAAGPGLPKPHCLPPTSLLPHSSYALVGLQDWV